MESVRVKSLKVGKIYTVSTRHARSPVSETYTPYPWGTPSTRVPVRILAEYSLFYVCEVLKHTTGFMATSLPYRITIDKFDLDIEAFKAYEELSEDEYAVYSI